MNDTAFTPELLKILTKTFYEVRHYGNIKDIQKIERKDNYFYITVEREDGIVEVAQVTLNGRLKQILKP